MSTEFIKEGRTNIIGRYSPTVHEVHVILTNNNKMKKKSASS